MNEYLKDRLKSLVQESLANLSADVSQIVDEMPQFDRYQALHDEVTRLKAENSRLQLANEQLLQHNTALNNKLLRQPMSTDAVLGDHHSEGK
jgi:hypothetical protein